MGKGRIARYSVYGLNSVAFIVFAVVVVRAFGTLVLVRPRRGYGDARWSARPGLRALPCPRWGGRLYSNSVAYVVWDSLALAVGMLV